MNPGYSMLYPYILAILASVGLVLLTRYGARDSGRRVFPDVTLRSDPEVFSVPTDPEAPTKMSKEHRVGTAVFIDSDFALPPQAELTNELIVRGSLTLGEGSRLHGSAKASGSISLGSHALVVGNLVSDSDISIGPGAEVVGVLHAKKDVRLMPSSSVSVSVVSARTIYIHEGARVGKKVFASRGIVYQPPALITQRTAEASPNNSSASEKFSQSTCHSCRSLLLALDVFRQQWRCMNCGSYQGVRNGLSPYSRNSQ